MWGLRALGALPYTGRPETAVTGAVKWYLKWPANTGNVTTNNALIQISGINGTLSAVRWTLAEAMPAHINGMPRYFVDTRRLLNSVAMGGSIGYFLQTGDVNNVDSATTSGCKINGVSVAASALFGNVAANSVCEVNFNGVPSDGCISFGARFNEIEHNYGLALKEIVIVDSGGTHTIDFSNKAGQRTFTSTDGAVTATLFNFNQGACWIPYLDTTVSNSLVNQGVNGVAKNFLRFTGGSNAPFLVHPTVLLGASSFDVELDFVPQAIPSGASYVPVYSNNTTSVDQRHAMYLWNSSRCEIAFIIGGIRRVLNSPSGAFTVGTRYKVNAVYDGSTFSILVNGVSVASMAASGTVGGSDGLVCIGANASEGRPQFDLYGYKITQNGTVVRNYQIPDNGSTLVDLASGQNATQVGSWPASNNEWNQYIDTSVSNPIVNQGVNGTANYFCTLNGTSYFTAPTLGNLLAGSPKIRINIKKFRQFGSSVEPIFWQGGNSWGTRELALRNNSSLGNIIIGGVATGFTWSDLTTAFGDPNLTCDEFGFEINGTNAIFYKNKVAVFTVPNLSKGTSRLDGALLFIGAQPSTDNAGATTAISIVPNGMQYGDIEILINDVLVRNYKMPDNGSTVVDTVGGNNLTQRGTFTIDNNEWRQYISAIASANPMGNFTTQSTAASSCTFNVLHRFDLASAVAATSTLTFGKRSALTASTVQSHSTGFSFSIRHPINGATTISAVSAFTASRFSATYGNFTTGVTVSFQSTYSKRLAQAFTSSGTASSVITFSKRSSFNLSSSATASGALEFKIRHSFTGATTSAIASVLTGAKRLAGAFNFNVNASDALTWRKRSIFSGTTTHTNIGVTSFAKRVAMYADTLVFAASLFEGFNPRNSIDIPVYAYSANIGTQHWNSADITNTFTFSAVLESIYEF